MTTKLKFFTGAALLVAVIPLSSQAAAKQETVAEPAAENLGSALPPAMLAEQQKMFDLLKSIFEVKDATPIAPAQLAMAEKAVVKILPDGVLVKVIDDMVGRFMEPLSQLTPDMAAYEISTATGLYDGTTDALDEEKRKAITLLLDPARKQRLQQGFDVIKPLLYKTMTELEAPMRTGMARAYARKFSASQLADLNLFLATPTGTFFASQTYPLQNDPEIWQATIAAMPKLMESVLAAAPSVKKEANALPKAKTVIDLGDDDIAKLAGLLGITVDALKASRDQLAADQSAAASAADEAAAIGTVQEAGDGEAEASDEAANETGEEPWYDDTNWTEAERTNVRALSDTHNAAAEKATEAFNAWDGAFTKALAASRAKYKAQGWKPKPAANGE